MSTVRERIRIVIFEAETPAGRFFDVSLLVAIVASVLAVSLESVGPVREQFGDALIVAEWFFTIAFTIEYLLRLYCIDKPVRYARSFFGIVDLLAILPTYLSFLIPGAQGLTVIRVIRLLRLLKLVRVFRASRIFARWETAIAIPYSTIGLVKVSPARRRRRPRDRRRRRRVALARARAREIAAIAHVPRTAAAAAALFRHARSLSC